MARSRDSDYLTVTETAELLGVSTETVRRRIKAFELPAQRASDAPQAPWLIHRPSLERRLEADAIRQRVRDRGIVVGRSDDGGPADQEFVEKIRERHGDETAENVRAYFDRRELLGRLEREMYDDPGVRQQLARLNDEERVEAEARELAQRIRRAERIRERALEILDEDD